MADLNETAIRNAVVLMRAMGLTYRPIGAAVALSALECRRINHAELLYRSTSLFSTVTRVGENGAAVVVRG